MKRFPALLLVAATILSGGMALAQASPTTSGSRTINLQYVHNVSVTELGVGKKVELRLMQALKDGETVLLPRGASAWATVTSIKNEWTERSITLHFEDLVLSDGRRAPVWVVPGSHSLRYTSRAQGVPILAFAGYDVFARIPWPVPQAGSSESASPAERKPELATSAASPAVGVVTSVEIASTPAGAEIDVDGAFVGNTPSTLDLPLGDHALRVSKMGFSVWTRQVHVTAGKIRIVAELEKKPEKK